MPYHVTHQRLHTLDAQVYPIHDKRCFLKEDQLAPEIMARIQKFYKDDFIALEEAESGYEAMMAGDISSPMRMQPRAPKTNI